MYDALNDQWRVYDDVVMDLCFMLIVPQLALKYIRTRKVLNAPITQDCARTLLERVIKRTYKRLLD